MILSSPLPSDASAENRKVQDVSNENREDPVRDFNLMSIMYPSDTEVTEDEDGKKEDNSDSKKELKKRGRPTSSIWGHFTDAAQPQKTKSNMCKHCTTLVNYQKKSESVKTHLKNCSLFRKVMNGIDDTKCPEWYQQNKKADCKMKRPPAPPPSAPSSWQTSIKQFALPAVTKHEKAVFQQYMAMHYYATEDIIPMH